MISGLWWKQHSADWASLAAQLDEAPLEEVTQSVKLAVCGHVRLARGPHRDAETVSLAFSGRAIFYRRLMTPVPYSVEEVPTHVATMLRTNV
jgi:hypothetical protein